MTTFNNDITIKVLGPQDLAIFKGMIDMFCETFEEWPEEHASEERLKMLLGDADMIAIAVLHNGRPVGGTTAYVMHKYYTDAKEAYLYDMAVHPDYQRRGIGLQLINTLKVECRRKHISLFFVEAEKEDAHAVDFYKKAGGKLTEVAHFDFEVS